MLRVILFSLLFFVSAAQGTVTNYKPLKMDVKEGDHLVVKGFSGSITLRSSDKSYLTISVQQKTSEGLSELSKELIDEWHFSMQRVDNQIRVSVKSPQSKEAWQKWVKNPSDMPEYHLVISGPSIPTSVAWNIGDIQAIQWKSSLSIQNKSGKILAQDVEGTLNISQQNGQILISKLKGPLDVDSYSANLKIDQVEGPIQVQNFYGSTQIIASSGEIDFGSYNGALIVKESEGRLGFNSERGAINVSQFKGALRGKSQQGSVNATLVGQVQARVYTKEGTVNLRLPNSGAHVNLGTSEGAFRVPSYLRLTRLPSIQLMRGKLRGKTSGQVYVRTESGSIKVR